MSHPLIGILGGMGPAATQYFYDLILKNTPATCDQDHISTLIYQATFLPDRSYCINHHLEDTFISQLKDCISLLKKSQVSCLAVPCNTVHYFLNKIQHQIDIPFFHLIDSCIRYLKDKNIHNVTLLSTQATIDMKLYHQSASLKKIQIQIPNKQQQAIISDTIVQIKAGKNPLSFTNALSNITNDLTRQNGPHFILGCTELPLVFNARQNPYLIDPMQCLASEIIHFCLANVAR